MATLEIINADVRTALRDMKDESVHCVVTSPPYYGLRDYGVEGQIGLEQTPEAYVQELVEVFREVRRVLRNDGTLWLNLGDSFARDAAKGQHKAGDPGKQAYLYDRGGGRASATMSLKASGLKPKNLIGIPWMVAFAFRADGWYLRRDIIWHKPNPMPESVKDRPTSAHEYIFLLSKSEKYYYDHEAVKEEAVCDRKRGPNTAVKVEARETGNGQTGLTTLADNGKRNRRSVWTVATKPLKEAHFATYPPDLIEPCILAGCPEGGVVLDPFCGAGTTLLVAGRHNRDGVGVELNPEYAEIARKRLEKEEVGEVFVHRD